MTGSPAPFFHLFFLDDELNHGKAMHERTCRSGLRTFVLNEGKIDASTPFDSVAVNYARRPSELLASIRPVLGRYPVAAIIDCDLKECQEAEYEKSGGGFGLWAKLAQDGRDLPPYLAPFVVIYSAKDTIYQIYEMVQPGPERGWLTQLMRPLVVKFDARAISEELTPISALLAEWIRETRTRFLRSCATVKLRELRHHATREDWREAWWELVEFDPGDNRQWHGSLATLFPEHWGRLRSGDPPNKIRPEVLKDLATSLPDAVTLVRRLLTVPRARLEDEPRFVPLKDLPLNSVSHYKPDMHAVTEALKEITKRLRDDLEQTFTLTGLDDRYGGIGKKPGDMKREKYPPDGILSFLTRAASVASGDELDKLIRQQGRPHMAGREEAPPHSFRALESRVQETIRGLCNRGLDPDCEAFRKLMERASIRELCNRGLASAGLSHLPEKEPWQQVFRFFPLAMEAVEVITSVIDANRKRYGPNVAPLWRVGIVPSAHRIEHSAGQTGGALMLQILAQTQDETGDALSFKAVSKSLQGNVEVEHLTELRALVCGQYDGVVRLIRDEQQIDVTWDSVESHDLADLTYTPLGVGDDPALKGVYDVNAQSVKGTWYLIEIGSREWDE